MIVDSTSELKEPISVSEGSLAKRNPGAQTGPASASRGYSPQVRDHFVRPRNVGSLDASAPDVGTATVGAQDQGAIIRMQIRVDESGIINDICFKAYGCGATIAAASRVTEWARGKSLKDIQDLRSTQLVQDLSLPPVKTHCAILAEDAIKAAVDHYTQRQE